MMRLGGWILVGVISGVVPLGGFWLTPGSPAWGLAPALAPAPGPAPAKPITDLKPGTYPFIRDYAEYWPAQCPKGHDEMVTLAGESPRQVCWNDFLSYSPAAKKDPIYVFLVLPSHHYKYYKHYGEFQINGSTFRACGLEERFLGGAVDSKRDTFYLYDVYPNSPALHKIELERDPKSPEQQQSSDNVDNALRKCKESRTPPAWNPSPFGFLWQTLNASAVAVAPQRRDVSGEFWLARPDDASPADARLWNCLIGKGNYPGVHFVDETTSVDEWAFIGPDARFRASLVSGEAYSWRLAPPIRCGILRTQAYRGAFRVPPAIPSGAEKLVLACLIKDEGFSSCQSWWLTHP